MGVPMVKSCCYCVSTHTGTLIIGYLYSLWALLELTGYTLLVTLTPLHRPGDDQTKVSPRLVLYVTAACVSGTHLLCSALLVLAAYKKLPGLTLPWTVVTGILTALVFVMVLTGVSLVLQDEGEVLAVEVTFICVHLARACVSVYCIVVVHSRHKQLMMDNDLRRFQHSGRIYSPVKTDQGERV